MRRAVEQMADDADLELEIDVPSRGTAPRLALVAEDEPGIRAPRSEVSKSFDEPVDALLGVDIAYRADHTAAADDAPLIPYDLP